MTEVRSCALVSHSRKPGAKEVEAELRGFLLERDIAVDDQDPDLVVSLGGDGTMLRAAQLAHRCGAPLLGINLGTLGYLTEVDAPDALEALERVLDGRFEIQERMMLDCSAGGRTFVGLNEVLVERSSRRRLVRLTVRVGDEELARFNADGVIVATPTGSTAYALSAGGPVVSPRAKCLVLVPVSAHVISARPFVLSPQETIEIHVAPDQEAALAIDGHIGCDLRGGTVVVVRRHDEPLRMVRLWGPDFLERLRIKLGLPG